MGTGTLRRAGIPNLRIPYTTFKTFHPRGKSRTRRLFCRPEPFLVRRYRSCDSQHPRNLAEGLFRDLPFGPRAFGILRVSVALLQLPQSPFETAASLT